LKILYGRACFKEKNMANDASPNPSLTFEQVVETGLPWDELSPAQQTVCRDRARSAQLLIPIGETGLSASIDGLVVVTGSNRVVSRPGVSWTIKGFVDAIATAPVFISDDAMTMHFKD